MCCEEPIFTFTDLSSWSWTKDPNIGENAIIDEECDEELNNNKQILYIQEEKLRIKQIF